MKKIVLIIGLVITVVFAACKKDTAIEGPELVDIFGEFKVLEPLRASIDSPDFSTNTAVIYHTKLSIRTNWTIEIISLNPNSAARKVFTGNDKDFSLNQVSWNGSITFAPFFRKNEKVVDIYKFGASINKIKMDYIEYVLNIKVIVKSLSFLASILNVRKLSQFF
jgi:hypothetical protein